MPRRRLRARLSWSAAKPRGGGRRKLRGSLYGGTRVLIGRSRCWTSLSRVGASLAVLLGLVVLASPWSAAGARVPCSGVCSTGDGGEHFDFGLVRFNADGSRDPSFADAAAATTSLQTGSSRDRAQARAVLIQPDGKIVVAGDARRGPSDQLVLARYSVDGSVDPSFGEGGQVITELGHEHDASAQAAVRLPDDGTVVAGSAGSNFALVRYRPDGSLDSSFGRSGLVTTDFGGRDRADALALQPDGRIVVAGRAGPGMALARYRPDGSLDASFGTGGRVVIQGRSKATDVLLQPDGKIVVLERSCVPGGAASRLSRFSRDGSPDLTFGRQGTARVPLGRDGWKSRPLAPAAIPTAGRSRLLRHIVWRLATHVARG